AAEEAVELRDARGDPFGFGGFDVDEPQQGLRRRLRRWTADDVLDRRPERVAAGALPEPPAGGVTAVGTCVISGRLGHPASLGSAHDAAPSGTQEDTLSNRFRLYRTAQPRGETCGGRPDRHNRAS